MILRMAIHLHNSTVILRNKKVSTRTVMTTAQLQACINQININQV